MSDPRKPTSCCGVQPYKDSIDKGWYCTICDTAIDPKTGKELR